MTCGVIIVTKGIFIFWKTRYHQEEDQSSEGTGTMKEIIPKDRTAATML